MDKSYRQNVAVESSELQDELMLLEPSTGQFCVLNRVSKSIWQSLREPVTAEQIATGLARDFQGVTENRALDDVTAVLDQMRLLGLIVESQ
jgi:coenzyme PQQ synthesis protein D (PqqD)